MTVKGFKQLRLRDVDWSYIDDRKKEPWKGKVVEKAGFVKDASESQQMFLILFTDKTYVCVGMNSPEHEDENYELCDRLIHDQSVFRGQLEKYHAYVGSDGTVHYDPWLQMLLDFGFYQLDDDDVRRIKEEYKQAEEERAWASYLALKERFKDRIEKGDDVL